ncbi:hypothetical protein BUY49_05975 [Staphylococcus devriesei]|uniref:hypothetical protein n=1 Tax=Staphylococcus devriesei TaxID=586733 RepID=UPI000E6A0B82|nr:hypothetical protein [Staphylococcus devriesei]RIL71586.1 hypothetical protein BUY49_05975 [Staphylococcus devriesei]
MKKIFASLGVILLVAILGVTMLFAYGSYKDLELKKAEAKLDEKKDKHERSNKENKKQQKSEESDDNENLNSTNQNIENPNNSTTENTTSTKKSHIDNSVDPYNIMQYDTNGDGVITRDEMTPELEKLEREGKFQVAVKGIDTVDDNDDTYHSGGKTAPNEDSIQLDGNGNPLPEIEVHDFTDDNGDGMAETINGSPNGDVGMDLEQQQKNIDAIKAEQDNE